MSSRGALVGLGLWLALAPCADAEEVSCDQKWQQRGITIGQSLDRARERLVSLGGKVSRTSKRDDHVAIVAELTERERIEIGALASTNSPVVEYIEFVELQPAGGDQFLQSFEQLYGKPLHSVVRREQDRVGALSEARIWVDLECDRRVVALLRRELTPRGALLRYGALRVDRLSSLVQGLDSAERVGDRLAGL
jgi:hypothetical protein